MDAPVSADSFSDADSVSDADSGIGSFGSSLGSSAGSYSSTVFSEIPGYVYENGRRYHSYREGRYPLPCDEREIERLEIHHHIWTLLLGGALYAAPIDEPRRVLDVGCGTGEWAIDMAERFPDAEVVGNDLSKIQPPWAPPNCRFEVDDAESTWTYPENHFDYIHMRCLGVAIADWDFVLSQAYAALAPGAYLELQDFQQDLYTCSLDQSPAPTRGQLQDPSASAPIAAGAASPFERWWDLTLAAARRIGRAAGMPRSMQARMRAAGFADVTTTARVWPITRWPENPRLDEIGTYGVHAIGETLQSYSTALFTRVLGWELQDVIALSNAARVETQKAEARYWCTALFVHARKPE